MAYGLSLGSASLLRSKNGSPLDGSVALDILGLLALERQGVPVIIPPAFADIEAENRIALQIYERLKTAFSECGELLLRSENSRYSNLIAIFFHEILRVLCSYFNKRFELDQVFKTYQTVDFNVADVTAPASPYVDYDFVLAPDDNRVGKFSPQLAGFSARKTLRRLTARLNAVVLSKKGGSRQAVLCICNLQTPIKPIMESLNCDPSSQSWKLKVIDGESPRIVIPELNKQYQVLESAVFDVASVLDLDAPRALVSHLKRWLDVYIVDRYTDELRADVLLIGSAVTPETRMAAARAKAQGIPVVSMSHSEASTLFDEPVFGYGENSLVDCVIGYGDYGCQEATTSTYRSPLHDEPVPHVPAASDTILSIYDRTGISKLSDIESPRFMYVPTSFTGNGRYGPYRDVHDVVYLKWQRRLLSALVESSENLVAWQVHPGNPVPFSEAIPGTQLTLKHFLGSLDDADVFVFDYLSTAYTFAAATSKPVIYLDIGLRNTTTAAEAAIQDRSICVKANLDDPESAWAAALARADKQCVNNFTNDYCLSTDIRPRAQIIAGVLNKAADGAYSPSGASR